MVGKGGLKADGACGNESGMLASLSHSAFDDIMLVTWNWSYSPDTVDLTDAVDEGFPHLESQLIYI